MYGLSCSDGIYTHQGTTKSFSSFVYMNMKDGVEVIVLSNDLRNKCEDIVREVVEIVGKYY